MSPLLTTTLILLPPTTATVSLMTNINTITSTNVFAGT